MILSLKMSEQAIIYGVFNFTSKSKLLIVSACAYLKCLTTQKPKDLYQELILLTLAYTVIDFVMCNYMIRALNFSGNLHFLYSSHSSVHA